MLPMQPSQDKELVVQLTFRAPVAVLMWLVVLACCTTSTAMAGLRVPFSDRDDGISCSFYDVGLGVPWQARGAGWLDTEDKRQGMRAHAAFQVFPFSPPVRGKAVPELGLAKNYPGDRGIAADQFVLFAEVLEARKPDSRWINNKVAPGEIAMRIRRRASLLWSAER